MGIMDVGSSIKKHRKRNKLTQKELAAKLGVSVHTLSKYEQNQREPNLLTIKNIAAALEVNISELLACRKNTSVKTTPKELVEEIQELERQVVLLLENTKNLEKQISLLVNKISRF